MDLLSLSPEILAKIFSNIPCNQLLHVKLCVSEFNSVIKKHHKYMKKPKLRNIFFRNYHTRSDGIDRIRVQYQISSSDGTMHGSIDRIGAYKGFFYLPSELDKLHSFIQKFDLTSLRYTLTLPEGSTKITRILSKIIVAVLWHTPLMVVIKAVVKEEFLRRSYGCRHRTISLRF
uniref:F-box domain-containing protein n=1 Tax=Strongyloides venezuelensis TaxID=75913 RepID=A0A0K0FPB9_STRVS